jgi:hypothetical protein
MLARFEPAHRTALVLLHLQLGLVAAIHIEAVQHQDFALYRFERRKNRRQREVAFAPGWRVLRTDGAAGLEDGDETLGGGGSRLRLRLPG